MIAFHFDIITDKNQISLEENEILLHDVIGSMSLSTDNEKLYQSNNVMILVVIIEIANAITRACIQGIGTRLSIMMEPIIDMTPHSDDVEFIDIDGGDPIAVESKIDLIKLRDNILAKLRLLNPVYFEVVKRRLLSTAS